jgi:hypothetical protein
MELLWGPSCNAAVESALMEQDQGQQETQQLLGTRMINEVGSESAGKTDRTGVTAEQTLGLSGNKVY